MERNPNTAPRHAGGARRGITALALVGVAVGAACIAQAQTSAPAPTQVQVQTSGPAAKLGKPQPITDSSTPIVTRGLAPETSTPNPAKPWMSEPTSPTVRPLFGNGNTATPPDARSYANVPSAVPAKKPSLVDSAWTTLKDAVVGKPTTPGTTPPTAPTATNAPQAMAANPYPQATAPTGPTPGVYAGPPAYRWYGWGTTTPGANSYAPNGQYPRGSANWYTQTGATPGAFPVPVTQNAMNPAPSEPPIYVGGANVPLTELPVAGPQYAPGYAVDPYFGVPGAGIPVMTAPPPAYTGMPVMDSNPPPFATMPMTTMPMTTMPVNTVPMPMASVPVNTTPMTSTPVNTVPSRPMPSTTGTMPVNTVTVPPMNGSASAPVPFNNTLSAPPPFEGFPTAPNTTIVQSGAKIEAPAFSGMGTGTPSGVNWQSSAPRERVTFTTSRSPNTLPANIAPQANPTPPQPAPTGATSRNNPAPNPVIRSQEPADSTVATLPAAIRNACYGWASVIQVQHIGPSKIVVRLIASCDADARAATETISQLPQLKDFTVDFEAKIGNR